MTSKPESQSTDEQHEERRQMHAALTLNNTAIQVYVGLRIPEGKVTPEGAKIMHDRHYVQVNNLDTSFDIAKMVEQALSTLQRDMVKALEEQMQLKAKEQASDGDAQVEDGPVHE